MPKRVYINENNKKEIRDRIMSGMGRLSSIIYKDKTDGQIEYEFENKLTEYLVLSIEAAFRKSINNILKCDKAPSSNALVDYHLWQLCYKHSTKMKCVINNISDIAEVLEKYPTANILLWMEAQKKGWNETQMKAVGRIRKLSEKYEQSKTHKLMKKKYKETTVKAMINLVKMFDLGDIDAKSTTPEELVLSYLKANQDVERFFKTVENYINPILRSEKII